MWKRTLTALPGVGVSVLPKLACPMCWPAYAGLLSSLGLGFLISGRYLMSVTSVLLLIAVASLGFRARRRRGYIPMLLGVAGSALVLYGKFFLESGMVLYGGVALLATASLWNSWPREWVSCQKCLSAAGDLIDLKAQEK